MSKFLNWRSLGLICVLWIVGGIHLCSHMRSPLNQDELLTVKKYSSVDYDSTAEEMRKAGRFNIRHAAKGVVRCFNNNWTPNNHILNSLLISASAFFLGFNEFAYRAPSLAAALLLAALVFCWAMKRTESYLLAFLCGLIVLFHPYFAAYGHAARGYVWTALLVLAQLWLVEIYFQRKPSTGFTIALGLLSILIFLNLASMLTEWIIPLYLAGGFYCLQKRDREHFRGWFFDAAVAATGIGIFTLANLPNFLSAQNKYGAHLSSTSELVGKSFEIIRYYFPFSWVAFGVAGVIGWFFLLRSPSLRWIALAAFASFFVSAAYICVTKTVPYPRVFGFYLVLLIVGVIQCWNAGKLFRPVVIVLLVLTLAGQWVKGAKISESPISYEDMARQITSRIHSNRQDKNAVFIPLPWVYGEEMRYYLPPGPDWSTLSPDKTNLVTVYFAAEKNGKGSHFRVQYARREQQEMVFWPLPDSSPVAETPGGGVVEKFQARVLRDFSELGPGQLPWIVVWNSKDPYFDLTHYVADQLRRGQEPWDLPVNTVYYLPAKSLDIFAGAPAAFAEAKAMVADLQSQSAGDLYLLVPENH